METKITKDLIRRAIISLKGNHDPFNNIFVLQSPNEGKNLIIKGPIQREEAAEMASKVWSGEAKIEDFEYMTETDARIF